MDREVMDARQALVARIVELVGTEPIPRLEEALTHPSFVNEAGGMDNQRLEFLGDAVLDLCVSEVLVDAYQQANEGRLTRMHSALVNAEALADWGRRVGIGMSLSMGRGATASGDREQTNVVADAVEAILAAVYLSHGLEGARRLVGDIVAGRLEDAERIAAPDPKGALQERLQQNGRPLPTYHLVERSGPAHEPSLGIEVMVEGETLGRGAGRSKKQAERAAALDALARLDGLAK
jgi:ribonuclease-3